MEEDFLFNLGTPLLLTGVELFFITLAIWWFFLYPRRKKFLKQLEKKFGLTYPKNVLVIRESKLKGSYRNYGIKMNPFTGGGNSWILLKCPNPKDFLAVIKPRKPLGIFRDPVNLLWNRREFLLENVDFDTKFKIIATITLPPAKILLPLIQEKLVQLIKKTEFEIQILHGGIFFSSEKEILDISLVGFILDLLVKIAENLSKKP